LWAILAEFKVEIQGKLISKKVERFPEKKVGGFWALGLD
jgi:hypothetical protein